MEYGKLIGGAYRIALHNWRLWPFGVFAGVGGGGFSFSYTDGDSSGGSVDIDTEVIVAIGLAALVLGLFALVMSVLAQGALVDGVAAVDRGEQRRFRQALRAARTTFWRVLGLYLLVIVLVLALVLAAVLVLGGAILATFAAVDALAVRILVVVLGVLAALALLFVVLLPLFTVQQHAIRALVLRGDRPVAALRGGWQMFRGNLGSTVIVLLIQQGLVLVGYMAVGLMAVVLCLPAIVVLIATSGGAAGIAVAVVTAVIVIPVGLAAAGAVGTFGHGLWTLGYLTMSASGGVSSPS